MNLAEYELKIKANLRSKHVSSSLSTFITYKYKFPFVTDTNLCKPLIWVPKLCVPIIDKTISKLLWNSLWKIAVAYF